MTFQAPDFGAQNRKVLVTPSFFPTSGNFCGFEGTPRTSVLFPSVFVSKYVPEPKTVTHAHTLGHIDWITIRQSHPGEALPVLSDGCVMAFDADGAVQNTQRWIAIAALEAEPESAYKTRLLHEITSLYYQVSRFVAFFQRPRFSTR